MIESSGILLIIFSFFLATSIVTYSPDDPNFIYSPENTEIKNAAGFYGSVVSDFFLLCIITSIARITRRLESTGFFREYSEESLSIFFRIFEKIFLSNFFFILENKFIFDNQSSFSGSKNTHGQFKTFVYLLNQNDKYLSAKYAYNLFVS